MRHMAKLSCQVVLSVLLFAPLTALAQHQDPIVGTWNESGALLDGSAPFLVIMNFNAGGTTVETDTAGTNSSASPGESIDLGTWQKTATRQYRFHDENFIYNSSGNLEDININVCNITMDKSQNSFTGTCVLSFYTCSLTTCPGTLVGQALANLAGTRF